MDIINFLNMLENTLSDISVKGKDNVDKLMGCFIAIDRTRAQLIKESEENGRQVDNGTESSESSL